MTGFGYSVKSLVLVCVLAGVVFGGCGVCGVVWFTDNVKVDVQWRK
jgi:hypothetical protein